IVGCTYKENNGVSGWDYIQITIGECKKTLPFGRVLEESTVDSDGGELKVSSGSVLFSRYSSIFASLKYSLISKVNVSLSHLILSIKARYSSFNWRFVLVHFIFSMSSVINFEIRSSS